MDITDRLNTILDDTGLSLEMLEYACQLLAVHKQLQKHGELYNIMSPADLPVQKQLQYKTLHKRSEYAIPMQSTLKNN